jgi:hypothetical protein
MTMGGGAGMASAGVWVLSDGSVLARFGARNMVAEEMEVTARAGALVLAIAGGERLTSTGAGVHGGGVLLAAIGAGRMAAVDSS